MKLKKIASLALAGVMAVSMLAGCSIKGAGNNGDSTVVAPANTSVVTAVNDGQSSNNKVKITFTSSTTLENAIKTMIADNGDKVLSGSDFKNAMSKFTGETYVNTAWGDKSSNPATKAGEQIVLYANTLSAMNETAALKMVADAVDDVVGKLVTTTFDKDSTKPEDTYYNYSYEGEIALVSATSTEGVTTWYYVYTIDQTAEAKKLEK